MLVNSAQISKYRPVKVCKKAATKEWYEGSWISVTNYDFSAHTKLLPLVMVGIGNKSINYRQVEIYEIKNLKILTLQRTKLTKTLFAMRRNAKIKSSSAITSNPPPPKMNECRNNVNQTSDKTVLIWWYHLHGKFEAIEPGNHLKFTIEGPFINHLVKIRNILDPWHAWSIKIPS